MNKTQQEPKQNFARNNQINFLGAMIYLGVSLFILKILIFICEWEWSELSLFTGFKYWHDLICKEIRWMSPLSLHNFLSY